MKENKMTQHQRDIQEILSVKNLQEKYFRQNHFDVYNRILNWSDNFKDCDFKSKLVWFVLDIKDFPICKICGQKVKRCITLWQYKLQPERIYLCSTKCTRLNTVRKQREHCMQLYGVPNISCLKSIKDKKKQTCIEHYGVSNPSQVAEIQEKKKITNLERYGNESAMKSDIIKNRLKESVFNKYGVDSVMKVPKIIEKLKSTNRERFGSDWFLGTKECIEKTRKTCREKYGVEWIADIESVASAKSQAQKNLDPDIVLARIASLYETGDLKNEEK